MILGILFHLFILGIMYIKCDNKLNLNLTIQGIEPNAGPLYGKT